MRPIFKKLVVYTAIAVSITTIFMLIPGDKQEISPLGTVLSTYFYNMHAAPTTQALVDYTDHLRTVADPELKKFYAKFDWTVKKANIPYNSEGDVTWQLFMRDATTKTNYLQYWQTARPAMQEFYRTSIPAEDISVPVVHFRCSDSPFNKNSPYHLSKASTVQWMAEQVKERGYDKVVMISCNKHRKAKNNPCADFANFYKQIFQNAGIKVEQQCNTVYKDFALMVHAPVLVTLNSSSYSFMAGIAKDPQNFISCNLGREVGGKYLMQDQADWLQDMREPLLHKDVKDYYDVSAVLQQLSTG